MRWHAQGLRLLLLPLSDRMRDSNASFALLAVRALIYLNSGRKTERERDREKAKDIEREKKQLLRNDSIACHEILQRTKQKSSA